MTESKLNNLFFALWPDRSVRDELVRLQQDLYGRCGLLQHQEDLHMTLVFLGKVTSEQLECIIRVADSVDVTPISIKLARTGYWKRPRIHWCGPDMTPDPLKQLVLDLQQALVTCGFEPEQRDYKPHVTLVRKAIPVAVETLDAQIVWRPQEFVLAGSCYHATLPRYQIVERWGI